MDKTIEYTRSQGYVEHKLSDILTIVMWAGLYQLGEIVSYAKNKW